MKPDVTLPIPATGNPRAIAPTPTLERAAILSAYPHIADCVACGAYAATWLSLRPARDVVTATLAFHDSSHSYDPLTIASQHFADLG
jgi:hypothetical protein